MCCRGKRRQHQHGASLINPFQHQITAHSSSVWSQTALSLANVDAKFRIRLANQGGHVTNLSAGAKSLQHHLRFATADTAYPYRCSHHRLLPSPIHAHRFRPSPYDAFLLDVRLAVQQVPSALRSQPREVCTNCPRLAHVITTSNKAPDRPAAHTRNRPNDVHNENNKYTPKKQEQASVKMKVCCVA